MLVMTPLLLPLLPRQQLPSLLRLLASADAAINAADADVAVAAATGAHDGCCGSGAIGRHSRERLRRMPLWMRSPALAARATGTLGIADAGCRHQHRRSRPPERFTVRAAS